MHENDEQYRLTFERAAAGVAHFDIDVRWLHMNQMVCELTGYSRDELRALTTWNITHPDDLDRNLREAARLLSGEIDTYSMEMRYIRQDRAVVCVHLTSSFIRDSQGAPRYCVSVVKDISDRKSAELALTKLNATLEQQVLERTRALRESEERTRHAADAGGVAISEWNFLTGSMVWSDLAFTALGYTPGEVAPSFKVWAARVHPIDILRVKQRFVRAMQIRARFLEEYRIVWRDGTTHVHECHSEFAYDDQGECIRMRGIWVDITERKRGEALRVERELQLRRGLIRDVHHRIKNHQQGVAGLLHHIIRRRPDLRETLAPAIAQMHTLSLVYELRGESRGPVAVVELVDEIVRMTKSNAEGSLDIRYQSDLPSHAQITDDEAVQLALIINELLANAIKHSPPASTPATITVEMHGTPDQVRIEVTNSGTLPSGFQLESAGQPGHSGLSIIHALLPPNGVRLNATACDGRVRMTLVITAPVLALACASASQEPSGAPGGNALGA
ncbi:MAG: PAS domain S-box protein [Burkholderiales bacterium]